MNKEKTDKEKLKEFFSKNKNTKHLYIILIIGVILLFCSNMFSDDTKNKSKNVQGTVYMPTGELANELEDILSEVKGAGDVNVMITYASTGEKHLAADVTSEQSQSKDGDTGENAHMQLQSKQTSKLFSPDDTEVVTRESFPEVMGVIVVCDGGGDIQVKADITNAVKAIMNVGEHKISVLAKK